MIKSRGLLFDASPSKTTLVLCYAAYALLYIALVNVNERATGHWPYGASPCNHPAIGSARFRSIRSMMCSGLTTPVVAILSLARARAYRFSRRSATP